MKILNQSVRALRVFLAVLLSSSAFALSPGDKVPEVSGKNQNGNVVHFGDYKGHYILVYFYPKDQTPGCTTEACSLRDQYAEIKKLNTIVLGVSRQDEKSHQAFIAKHKLPFDLLVDTDGAIGKTFGVGTYFGTSLSKRQSILIGPDGKVVHFYEDVKPETHVKDVIADIKADTEKSAQH